MAAVGYASGGGGGGGGVTSVNGDVGPAVVLDAADVGADAAGVAVAEVDAHEIDTTNVHGISDTAQLATNASVSASITTALLNAASLWVTGAATSVDDTVVRFDGTTGKRIQGSLATINDAGTLQAPSGIYTGSLLVTGGNLTITRTDGTGSYRLRTTGGGLDFDIAGLDVFLSKYANADFSGAQSNIIRLESAGPHLIGRVQFGTSPFDTVHDIDSGTGIAGVGAKNSLTNVRIAGRRATAGAPTTGTWAVGDAVQDVNGRWYTCTGAGTPGTWVGHNVINSGYVSTGDLTLTNVGTTWTVVPTLSGFTIPAAIGDRIEFRPSFLARMLGTNFLDQAVMVAGVPVRVASNGATGSPAAPAVEGDPTGYRDAGDNEVRGMGPFVFTAAAGDISGGLVSFAIIFKGTGTTSIVYASTNYPFRWVARNWGPA